MVTLHVEDIVHAFTVGKCGRVADNQVKFSGRNVVEPFDNVPVDILMLLIPEEFVVLHVPFSPVQVGLRHVYGCDAGGFAVGCVNAEGTGVAKQVEYMQTC